MTRTIPFDELKARLAGSVVTPADPDFAGRREGLIWNGRKPAGQPRAIVRAATAADVQEAVRFAARAGIPVSARGTGHNFSGIAQQEGMVIDLSQLAHLRIDAAAGTAEVGPGMRNGAMAEALTAAGFAFPLGHCASVSLSGYLLGGGFGWNTAEWGMACQSILEADVVLASGELVTVSAESHPDLFWALRGGGPMVPGIVVSYRIRLRPFRAGMMQQIRIYPLDRIDEVSRWMQGVMAVAPQSVEFTAVLQTAPAPFPPAKVIVAIATVFAADAAEATEALDGVALWAPAAPIEVIGPMPATYAGLYAATAQGTPEGARYLTEAVWSAEPRALFGRVAAAIARAPSHLDHAILNVLPAKSPALERRADAAISTVAEGFAAVYSIWTDGEADALHTDWLRQAADTLAPLAAGYYVGEADLARPERLAQCYAPEVWARLHIVRGCYDPAGLFRRALPVTLAPDFAIAAE